MTEELSEKKKRGRPTKGDRPMSGRERQAAHMARLKTGAETKERLADIRLASANLIDAIDQLEGGCCVILSYVDKSHGLNLDAIGEQLREVRAAALALSQKALK